MEYKGVFKQHIWSSNIIHVKKVKDSIFSIETNKQQKSVSKNLPNWLHLPMATVVINGRHGHGQRSNKLWDMGKLARAKQSSTYPGFEGF